MKVYSFGKYVGDYPFDKLYPLLKELCDEGKLSMGTEKDIK